MPGITGISGRSGDSDQEEKNVDRSVQCKTDRREGEAPRGKCSRRPLSRRDHGAVLCRGDGAGVISRGITSRRHRDAGGDPLPRGSVPRGLEEFSDRHCRPGEKPAGPDIHHSHFCSLVFPGRSHCRTGCRRRNGSELPFLAHLRRWRTEPEHSGNTWRNARKRDRGGGTVFPD